MSDKTRRDVDQEIAQRAASDAERDVDTLLVTEPNSIEAVHSIAHNHEILREVGTATGVPVVEMHTWLAEQREWISDGARGVEDPGGEHVILILRSVFIEHDTRAARTDANHRLDLRPVRLGVDPERASHGHASGVIRLGKDTERRVVRVRATAHHGEATGWVTPDVT